MGGAGCGWRFESRRSWTFESRKQKDVWELLWRCFCDAGALAKKVGESRRAPKEQVGEELEKLWEKRSTEAGEESRRK